MLYYMISKASWPQNTDFFFTKGTVNELTTLGLYGYSTAPSPTDDFPKKSAAFPVLSGMSKVNFVKFWMCLATRLRF